MSITYRGAKAAAVKSTARQIFDRLETVRKVFRVVMRRGTKAEGR